MVGDGLYKIWKIEQEVWLNGLKESANHVLDDAVIVTTDPFRPVKFTDFIETSERVRAFESIEMTNRQFKDLGQTVIIAYIALAKHERFRRVYKAQCTTVYTMTPNGWNIAAHHHAHFK